ncbi:hypothetical protein BDF19DRAFT_271400 [Syncephalis fuscata]|nr:hypothetical protein BDF19DRAFT_271400 [Syncephalis fuscata]
MYSPHKVKGLGRAKLGQCPLCYGMGESAWFHIKISSYWYHMNFFHGISSVTKQPYHDPILVQKRPLLRIPKRPSASSTSSNSSFEFLSELHDGLCHHCHQWIPMDSVKQVVVKVPMIYWWKHAQRCHHSKKL